MSSFLRKKNLKSMRKLYRTVRNFKYQKQLYASTPIYEICDDHDYHCNNSNRAKRDSDTRVWMSGRKSYMEYQHYLGPSSYIGKLWYSFSRNNAIFFVFDTRSERDETKREIISLLQMEAFEKWIKDENSQDKIKFVVSPVPLVSQNSEDSWYGFPEQQKKVINLITSIDNVYVLAGDAHCARVGKYKIYDENDIELDRTVTEVVSSGLVAINHDKGKSYNGEYITEEYDKDNDFPFKLDNSKRNGLKFITNYASKCYPKNKKCSFLDKLDRPFNLSSDNIFTKIIIDNGIKVEFYDLYNRKVDSVTL